MITDAATGAGLRAAIIDPANHADDALRLVYADWLEENGAGARAEFIRVQVELTGMDGRRGWSRSDVYRAVALRRREREIVEKYGQQWISEAGLPPGEVRIE